MVHMNSSRKPVVQVTKVNGKKFQRNCFCCPSVLFRDDEDGNPQVDDTSSIVSEGGETKMAR